MFNMRLDGDIKKLTKHLSKLADIDKTGINQAIAETIRASTRQRFKKQQSPEGKSWKPSKRALETGGVTLSDKARLRNSIRSRADDDTAEVGTNVVYGARHQFGDKRPMLIKAKSSKGLRFRAGGRWVNTKSVKVQLPARPFLGINQDDMDEIKNILEEVVTNK